MKTVIIKYNAGNVQSVMYALDRIGASYEWSDEPDVIASADRVIFPGVGEASTAMNYLKERQLDTFIPTLKQPVLGTCVGMQLMCQHSEENDTHCMGIFDVLVKRFPKKEGVKVPQTGWNDIYDLQTPLCESLNNNSFVYYNHSFYAELCEHTVAKTDYVLEYSAMLQKNNFYAAQFHAEISGNIGQTIFENFLKIRH